MTNFFPTRREAARSLLDNTFDSFFDSFFKDFWATMATNANNHKKIAHYPKIDALVKDQQFIMQISVPGMSKEDVSIEITKDNTIRIAGRSLNESSENCEYFLKELFKTTFIRELSLPPIVTQSTKFKAGEIAPTAEMKNGILTLAWEIETKPPPRTTTKIEIK